MPYSSNLKNEKAPTRKVLLPEGPRTMTVMKVVYGKSKQNNPQFVFDLKDDETGHVDQFYAVDVEGKRGNLKMILDACKVPADAEGNYTWDDHHVVGKQVVCHIIHEPNTYINKQNQTITTTQHRIAEIEELAWEE